MKKHKKIKVSCCGPIAFKDTYKSMWEDVWLTWTSKPGRKKNYLGPTLISFYDAIRECKQLVELQKDNPDLDYSEEIQEYNNLIKDSQSNGFSISWVDKKCPTVITDKECINREEADKMINYLMQYFGFKKVTTKWTRPKLMIVPV